MIAKKVLVITALLTAAAFADVPPPPGVQTAGPPAPPQPLNADAPVDDVLDALNAQGHTLNSFSATITSTDEDLVMNGDPVIRSGKIFLIKDKNGTRLHLNYLQKKTGKRTVNERREYLLDGLWLTDRDYTTKTETVRQIIKEGNAVNLFQLGKGPFPLPIGQPKEAVTSEFDVAKIGPAVNNPQKPDPDFVPDPPNSIHLQLKPKANTPLAESFKTIDVWVDRATDFPVRIKTRDKKETVDKTTEFSDLTINGNANPADFVLDGVDKDWKSSRIPLGQ